MAIIKKTDNLLEELIYCDFRTSVGIDKGKRLIRKALRGQDRDTRHACAEAVEKTASIDLSVVCNVQQACSACINCNNGL